MTLENIVQSLEDCKRIPQGSFTDSALVWLPASEKIAHVFARDQIAVYSEKTLKMCIPAPTLAEILAELPFGTIVMLDSPNTWVCIARLGEQGTKIKKATNPAEAALLLWLELKGMQG